MNRVILNFTLAVIAGILLPKSVLVYTILLAVLAICYLAVLIFQKRHFVLVFIAGVVLGIFLGNTAFNAKDSVLFPYVNQSVSCVVEVDSVPNVQETYVSFHGTVRSINGEAADEKILVYVYNKTDIYENQRITFDSLKIKLPEKQRNFGSFDYQKYLSGKNIFFTATANGDAIKAVETCEMNLYRYALKCSAYLSRRVDAIFRPEAAAIFKAVLLGNKNDVDSATRDTFSKSGLSHVMAVSGLHLAILVMLLGLFLKRVNRWIRFAIITVFTVGFAALVGFPSSVLRASVMLLMLYLADTVFLEGDSLTNLSLIALILQILNPNCIYDTGFVLSFAATLGILCLTRPLSRLMPKSLPQTFKDSICVTVAAQIGTLPFSVMFFGQFSMLAIISNLMVGILLPLIYFFGLAAVAFAWKPLIVIAEFCILALPWWAKICAMLPGQIQNIPVNTLVLCGLFLFTLVSLAVMAFKNKKWAVWLLFIAFLITAGGVIWQLRPIKGTEITFFNVNQSDAAMVRNGETVFLVDCGTESMGNMEVADYLLRHGITKLDGIFISHFDSDHSGGLIPVLEAVKVSALYVPDTKDVGLNQYKALQYLNERNIPVFTLKKGDMVQFPGINLTVLHPEEKAYSDGDNNTSLVFRADNKDVSALFPGDMQNDNLLENCDADILKVSHHGSKNGSTEEFLQKCTPDIAVISLAANNIYGFPHDETMNKLKQYTNRIYRTDERGTVIVRCDNKNYTVQTLR